MQIQKIVSFLITLLLLTSFNVSYATGLPEIEVYKSPTCGCCNDWIDHLKENGFPVKAHNTNSVEKIKDLAGVGRNLRSCHTAVVEGYVIEGHVPADLIKKMLKDKADINGLTVPGMPMGSPGMEGHRKDDYQVLTMEKDGTTRVYANR